ncbi:hypothetical protein QGN29_09890 [Temperatibacter marinus]|uniref:Uncharacterized protein n=1 Tax=Temperatibacter marinus TaxID=1456591 RepID=A0AA52EBP4_9PROT|nr:hypothetical protein [Temperatibacter marinus]WND01861.1 hypothetical protein QGN29_09890 [Temperatibacter marinus]
MKQAAEIIKLHQSSSKAQAQEVTDAIAADVARALDKQLEEMIEQLEKVSSCQQSGPSSFQMQEIHAFAAFCAGLETIAQTLIPHLRAVYEAEMARHEIAEDRCQSLYAARAREFHRYLIQLAKVHGLAFEGAPEMIGDFEEGVLANFEAKLRIMSKV